MKQTISYVLFALALATNSAYASVLNTSVTCTDINTGNTVTASSTCSTSLASASVSTGATIANGILTVTGNASATADLNNAGPTFLLSSSDASGSLDYTFTSTGAVRPGFIEIDNVSFAYNQTFGVGSDNGFSYQLTDSTNQQLDNFGCYSSKEDNGGYACPSEASYFHPYTNPLIIPVTLGTTFTLVSSEYADAASYVSFHNADGSASFDTTFQFFEADGVTPAFVATPEPGMWSLTLSGLAAVAFSVRCRRQKAQK